MKVIVVDFSNSSLKFALYDKADEKCIAKGLFERIGLEESKYTLNFNEQTVTEEVEVLDQEAAVQILLNKLQDLNIINSIDEISCIGHKIIHGGEKYSTSTIINDFVINDLESLIEFAPLHTSGSLKGIKAFQKILPDVVMVGVFDTAFYQSMDKEKYLYPIPYKWYSDYGVRKYGFNGINHKFISTAVKDYLGKDNFKMISCYADKTVSISAIENMKCIDTSMGFTPLAGAMMETRSGDVDSSIIPFIMEKEGKNASEVIFDLNKNSGLLGLSEYSNSIFDIVENAVNGDEKCQIAKNKYVQRIVDYIAQYYVLLCGVDAIALSGNVFENAIAIRREVCEKLAIIGIKLDLDLNNKCGEFTKISSDDSEIDVFVVPTDEELIIARETFNLVENR